MKDATNALVRNYGALCGWIEAQELRQQAELAKLEAARTWKPGGAPLVACQGKAMLWSLWEHVRRVRAPVHADPGNRAGAQALDAARAVDIEAARDVSVASVPADEQVDRRRIVAIALRELAALPSGHLAGEVLIFDHNPAEVAEAQGIPVREVYLAVRHAKRHLSASQPLRAYAEEYL